MTTAKKIAATAARLVGGDRARKHGDKLVNHGNIAALWSAYLARRGAAVTLTPADVALMMVLLKVARTLSGAHNPDDYIDAAGYAACAGEIAAIAARRRKKSR